MMDKKILPGHGSGGKMMNELIENTIRRIFGGSSVQIDDSAVLKLPHGRIAFTTDTFTVTPIFFPGGDIGRLAVNGTVNDLAVMGAAPAYISCALVLEEGFDTGDLEKILLSMKSEADSAGVSIVTGDTKVVPHGKGDRIYINTSGIGVFERDPERREIVPGDRILINGTIGDHGTAVMSERNRLASSGALKSDCAHLNHLIKKVMDAFPGAIKFMRDPTRGGVASVLNEITKGRSFGARLYEENIPVRNEVKGVCGMLGIDPLYVANEGKVVIIVSRDAAERMLDVMKRDDKGLESAIIGEIDEEFAGKAYLQTEIGGKRLLPLLIEEQLPRIC